MRPFRDLQNDYVRQFVGQNWSDNGAEDRVPVNTMELAASIFIRLCAPSAPKATAVTRFTDFKPVAANLELAANRTLEVIELGRTLRRGVLTGMFGPGVVKVAMAESGTVDIDGYTHAAGQVFADNVNLDDWVCDLSAKYIEKCLFYGDRYRLPYEWVMDSPVYNRKAKGRLRPVDTYNFNEDGSERIESLGRGDEMLDRGDELRDMVELWDLYLPQEKLLVTMTSDYRSLPLNVVEWSGPDAGPYHILSYNEVPNNVMPLPPAALWLDLHLLINELYRKLGRQAERQKTILGVAGDAKRDGSRIVEASDGEAVVLQNPDRCKEYTFGGVNKENMAFAVHALDMFKVINGNLDMLGGLGAQAPTASQEQLVAQNASKRADDMAQRTIEWARGIVKAIGHFLWYDPLIELPLIKRIPGTRVDVPTVWSPESRRGDFLHYNVDIDVYSMQHQTPSMRLAKLLQIYTQIILPSAQELERQGLAVNVRALVETVAKHADLQPELADVLVEMTESPVYKPGPVGEPPRKAAVSRREQVRINVPGSMTNAGRSSVLISELLGKGRQPAEQSAQYRMAG
jgi:hypothetical protein